MDRTEGNKLIRSIAANKKAATKGAQRNFIELKN
jgi:hypothetical protein